MTAPRPRRWFQIHLSTAVVLMVAAGILLWVNLMSYQTDLFDEMRATNMFCYSQGWPCYFRHYASPLGKFSLIPRYEVPDQWSFTALVLDVAVATAILCVIGYGCEFLARRREARKP